MSRSDPYKRKPKQAKYTVFAYGEGETEEAFLKHIKRLYSRNTNLSITVDKAGGKSPEYIVRSCINRIKNKSFDRKFILLDSDKSIGDDMKELAQKHEIELILSEPYCIEGMLIHILEPKFKDGGYYSEKYKTYFTSKYISRRECTKAESYKHLFPKPLIDKAKKRIRAVNRTILYLSRIPPVNK